MGGSGSTRWGGHARRRTIGEQTVALRVPTLARALAEPVEQSGTFGGLGASRTTWALAADDESGRRVLSLAYAFGWDGEPPRDLRDVLTLEAVPQPFGGVRWWFRCPSCRRRRAALYLVPVVHRFRCRQCTGLAYYSQRCDYLQRLQLAMQRIARRLGDESPETLPDLPNKPTGMHWRTYHRLADDFGALGWAHLGHGMAELHAKLDRWSPGWRNRAARRRRAS